MPEAYFKLLNFTRYPRELVFPFTMATVDWGGTGDWKSFLFSRKRIQQDTHVRVVIVKGEGLT